METETVTDLYQASYYLMNGCVLIGVDCIPTGNTTNCEIVIYGANLVELTQTWFTKKAVVNVWAFRNAYSQINSHVQQAKRSYEASRRKGVQS